MHPSESRALFYFFLLVCFGFCFFFRGCRPFLFGSAASPFLGFLCSVRLGFSRARFSALVGPAPGDAGCGDVSLDARSLRRGVRRRIYASVGAQHAACMARARGAGTLSAPEAVGLGRKRGSTVGCEGAAAGACVAPCACARTAPVLVTSDSLRFLLLPARPRQRGACSFGRGWGRCSGMGGGSRAVWCERDVVRSRFRRGLGARLGILRLPDAPLACVRAVGLAADAVGRP